MNGGGGLPFGDGLRCAGGDVRRLGIETPVGAGGATFDLTNGVEVVFSL